MPNNVFLNTYPSHFSWHFKSFLVWKPRFSKKNNNNNRIVADLSEWSTSSLFVCLWMVSRHGAPPPAWIHNCLIEDHSDWEPGTSVTGRPHTDKHALEKNVKNLMCRYSCWLRLRRDWNASHCFESHLATMGRSRTVCSTMPPRCSVQKSLSDARCCCGTLLGSVNCLGNGSLVQLIR